MVEKGYTQEERIDYEDTFSPVVRITSVRLILAIVAHMDLELYQMVVKTAFINGEQDEEIYMDQPLCFESKRQERKVFVDAPFCPGYCVRFNVCWASNFVRLFILYFDKSQIYMIFTPIYLVFCIVYHLFWAF